MNQQRQFALTALAVFVPTVVLATIVTPGQDAAAIVYIMIAVVLPAPLAYFLVYLDGFDRLNPFSETSAGSDYDPGGGEHRPDHNEPDGDDADPMR